jgi:hypothetical protein
MSGFQGPRRRAADIIDGEVALKMENGKWKMEKGSEQRPPIHLPFSI